MSRSKDCHYYTSVKKVVVHWPAAYAGTQQENMQGHTLGNYKRPVEQCAVD